MSVSPTRWLTLLLAAASPATVLAGAIGSLGIETSSLANPFFKAIVRGVVDAARAADPQVEITTLQNEYDLKREAANLQQMTRQKVRLLIISAADPERVAPLLAQARASGMVVVAVDVSARGAQATVMTDNLRAGEIACQHLAETLKGQGKVAIQNGPQVSSVIERVKGCKQALQRFPGLRLVREEHDGKGSPIGGQQAMQTLLRQHPDIAGVFTINDPQALGSARTLLHAGREDVRIASVDGSPGFAQELRHSPSLLVSATQSPYQMARRAVEIGTALLAGQTAPSAPILMEPGLLTRENIEQYRGWLGEGNPQP